MPVRELTVDVVRSFQRNGRANLASAMAFRVIWRSDVAPELKKNVSDAAYRLISDTVGHVLSQEAGVVAHRRSPAAPVGRARSFGPLLTGDLDGVLAVLSFLIRWPPCVLAVGVGLLVRFGPAASQPLPWASLGTGLVFGAWVLTHVLRAADLRVTAGERVPGRHPA